MKASAQSFRVFSLFIGRENNAVRLFREQNRSGLNDSLVLRHYAAFLRKLVGFSGATCVPLGGW
jgi:hypothetical protein